MGIPRSKVDKWDAGPLGQISGKTTAISQKIGQDADTMHRTVDNLDWSGSARGAAVDRVDREQRQIRKVGDALNTLGTHASNGSSAMQPMITSLKTSATGLEDNNFAVADDWTVTDKNNYSAAIAAAGDNAQAKEQVLDMQRDRAEDARNETVRLQNLASELEIRDTACGNAITAANNDIRSLAPPSAGLSPAAADHDIAAVRDGKATPEDLARIHDATQIPQELKDRIARGEEVSLPQGQLDYIQQMMRAQDGMSVDDIAKLSSNMPPGHEGDLIDGMQIASSPQVHAASADGVVVDKGGMDKLPTHVQTLLKDSPITHAGLGGQRAALG